MSKKKIHSMQKQVDELNQLWEDAVGAESRISDQEEEFCILLQKLQDDNLKDEEFDRLQERLRNNPADRDYYVRYMSLSALLNRFYNPQKTEDLLELNSSRLSR